MNPAKSVKVSKDNNAELADRKIGQVQRLYTGHPERMKTKSKGQKTYENLSSVGSNPTITTNPKI